MIKFKQFPEPGRHLLRYSGDTLEIRIYGELGLTDGQAFISTNIGNATIRRNEIIEETEERITAAGGDWIDIPMERVDDYTFAIRFALTEPGHFECKCSFVPQDGTEPVWAEGDNLHINVKPAAYCARNSVYCAFVRQFGQNKNRKKSELPEGITREELIKFDDNGYALIPESGTFRDLIGELDHIVNTLQCRIIHLLPVNPVPTVYGRMGRYGSPYASLDFTGIDPALAEFDKKATPLDQFIELADAVHQRDAKLFLDIAINHTGWAAKLHEQHPDWLVHEPDGTIHSPGAWGVVWGDLTELDHSKRDLWEYLADMFLTWCIRGVDGFRCDAGYMIPCEAWTYIIARVRKEYPETIFLLEGLGGDAAVTRQLLDMANMDWAYSELFQNYSREQIEGYLQYAWRESSSNGVMIHYAETHDNNRLASVSTTYASMRTALAALSSVSGAFGFANGVEWFAEEKIDVHESSALNWGSEINQIPLIRRLNLLSGTHPAFQAGAMLSVIPSNCNHAVVFSRIDANNMHPVTVSVNLDIHHSANIEWSNSYTPEMAAQEYAVDLISGKRQTLIHTPDGKVRIILPAGKFVCLSVDKRWLDLLNKSEKNTTLAIDHLTRQAAKAMVLRLIVNHNRTAVVPRDDFDPEEWADMLLRSPEDFFRSFADGYSCRGVVVWHWPEDCRREVMIPPGHAILAVAPYRFRCLIKDEKGVVIARAIALKDNSGRYFALIPPPESVKKHRYLSFLIRVYKPDCPSACFSTSGLFQLPPDIEEADVDFNRNEIYNRNRVFLQSNGCGAIIHQQMEMEKLSSRYDAILLANLNKNYPEDRYISWRRMRIWIVWHARRQELKHEQLHSFHVAEDGGGVWDYLVPIGNGLFVRLCIKMRIIPGKNAVAVTLLRYSAEGMSKRLADNAAIQIIIRPDIEDRNFHCCTKAAAGPEQNWPGKIVEKTRGFEFHAAPDRILSIRASHGTFKRKDAWIYMMWMENEANRGLDPHSDLYSPGSFKFQLGGNDCVNILGEVLGSSQEERCPFPKERIELEKPMNPAIEHAALYSLGQFVVKRDDLKTVIAGYPWFLDWGRDTLIAVRGLIAAGCYRDDVRKILLQFAKFEKDGTIPNMISGANADNRDTTDAPLWLFTATADFCRTEGNYSFLDTVVRKKETFRDVLGQLARNLIKGTPNGILCDKDSMLLFSPPHFTWMDTNYPAGTPREGYPIEIQALWFATLSFLSEISQTAEEAAYWKDIAEKVQTSIQKFFTLPNCKYLSDCLHCKSGTPAAKAIADDHLRPNQLLAITLGAVTDQKVCAGILDECASLLVPGAIRSLADRDTKYKLPVYAADGRLLNQPDHPYFGTYEGDEDTRRKPAYHNGTAWTWQFPLYPEAYCLTWGEFGKETAKAYLSSMVLKMDSGCVMQLPEIIDGDAPHTGRGCDAQAWGMSEFYRVWKLLHKPVR